MLQHNYANFAVQNYKEGVLVLTGGHPGDPRSLRITSSDQTRAQWVVVFAKRVFVVEVTTLPNKSVSRIIVGDGTVPSNYTLWLVIIVRRPNLSKAVLDVC